MSGAMTRREHASSGITRRQLAQALTPGPEPCISSTGAPSPWSWKLVLKLPVRTRRPISGLFMRAPSQLDADIAQLGVELERMHAAFPTDARGLGAAERGAQVTQEPAVDPADAHLDLAGDAMRAAEVLRPHRGGETVVGGIGQRDGFLLGVEGRDVTAGAEDLLAHHGRVFRQAGPDRGLPPVALGQCAL